MHDIKKIDDKNIKNIYAYSKYQILQNGNYS